ncbi:MAG: hypothetical protein ACP5F8_00540 [Candidatus Aenigmatarchaeota archaeon]
MALQIFKKKERVPPIGRVKELSSHGFSEPEIIDVLRKEGYSPKEIDIALSEALKEQIKKVETIETREEAKSEEKLPTLEEIAEKTKPKQEPALTQYPQTQDLTQYQSQQYSWDDFFNYIDYLIQSRINELKKDIENVNAKYLETERRINELSASIKEVITSKTEEERKILVELDKLDNDIKELSTKISTLEEIFKEILPALIDSVRSLSKLVNK